MAKAIAVIDGELATLPVVERPAEQMNLAELLGDTSRLSLLRLREIVSQPIDPTDLKQQRLIGDMALGSVKLMMRGAQGEFHARKLDRLGELLAAIAAAKKPAD